MQITFNGQKLDIPNGTNLLQFISNQGLDHTAVVIERNGQITSATEYPTTILEADDVLEVLHFVGGG